MPKDDALTLFHHLTDTTEHRQITQYADIPPVVRDAILATEDKHFFSHNGVDYFSIQGEHKTTRATEAHT